jgi:hypothetical protein
MKWQEEFPDLVEKFDMAVLDASVFGSITRLPMAISPVSPMQPFDDIAKHFGGSVHHDMIRDAYVLRKSDGEKMEISPMDIYQSDISKIRSEITKWFSKPTASDTFTEEDRLRIYELKRRARDYMSKLDVGGDILAGGCFTSWVHGEPVKDYDIFLYNQSSKMKLHEAILLDETIHMPSRIPSLRYTTSRISSMRYTIRDGKYLNNGRIDQVIDDGVTKAQYINCDYIDREAVIDHFDVEHSCVSYEYPKDILHISPLTWHCIKNKILKSHKNNTIQKWRQDKFIKKGFKFEINLV